MIMSTARDYIKPEKVSEYLPLIKQLIEETRKEDNIKLSYGCEGPFQDGSLYHSCAADCKASCISFSRKYIHRG